MQLENDILQRFIFEKSHIRGEIVRLKKSYEIMMQRHPYPAPVANLLGQALTATTLLGGTLKFKGILTLQIQTEGLVDLIVTQTDEAHHIRGLAQWQDGQSLSDAKALLGQGQLALTITPTQGERYQGIVAIDSDNIAGAIETYFKQSEQLATCLMLFANQEVTAGILLQVMPEIDSLERKLFWEHLVSLTRTLQAEELLDLSNKTILKRLFHQEDILLFEPEPVSFRCNCTRERMERAVYIIGYKEACAVLNTYKILDVTCEFCNNHYEFDAVDIERIFADPSAAVPPSEQSH